VENSWSGNQSNLMIVWSESKGFLNEKFLRVHELQFSNKWCEAGIYNEKKIISTIAKIVQYHSL